MTPHMYLTPRSTRLTQSRWRVRLRLRIRLRVRVRFRVMRTGRGSKYVPNSSIHMTYSESTEAAFEPLLPRSVDPNPEGPVPPREMGGVLCFLPVPAGLGLGLGSGVRLRLRLGLGLEVGLGLGLGVRLSLGLGVRLGLGLGVRLGLRLGLGLGVRLLGLGANAQRKSKS